ncbi:imidazolonepropionase [Kroppenstedtia eburnea]|uniref:Imidazolonepropionase n=1 Tax=Kroppenstedtia eburnea TaxID=714067 RepID=A0A1N7PZU2_9BACL|nr:imidazolonepropionase [Kroppenstedtia eburnea]QKI81076.1 imidazolonepropionase [Kroppenstedtia eburnea]SIT16153.1 imidazolonepropionase [Kroppenstedtia eburnea]
MSGKPLLIQKAAQLVTLKGSSTAPLRGKAMEDLHIIEDGSVWVEDGIIRSVGTDAQVREQVGSRLEEAEVVDAAGRLVTPGLVDPHTHLVFAGSRENEFEMRLQGATYMEIMEAGGGIHATTSATRQADEEQLYQESRRRLDQFLRHGVTTVEAKSGYGLSLEHELKQLKVAQKLNRDHPVNVVSTFMGAHAIPAAYKERPDEFVEQVIREMIPEVARRKLAEFNDVFCERGVFTPDQSRRILEAGKEYGLAPKIHADEIEPYGGAELAAQVGAVSADHLLKASDEGIRAMAEAGVVAVLLPGTAFFLMAEMADGRKMVDAGVPVALSTDCNPGSSPTISLPLIMNLGCLKMGMTPAEVLTATTINAAHAIRRGHEIGSLEAGKKADLVVFDVPNYMGLQYHYGSNHTRTVIKDGKVVYERD